MTHFDFSERTEALLHALCFGVRLFSLQQIGGQWWYGDKANARTALRRLESRGLVLKRAVLSRTLPKLNAPVLTWAPGDASPDFGHVAYCLKRRWQGRAPRRTTVYLATTRAANLFGSRARGHLTNPVQAQHDLALAEVYLWFLNHEPQSAAVWRGEDQLAAQHRREKLPDAFLLGEDRRPIRFIEQGGGYDKPRIEAFHAYARSRNVPYELW